MKSLLHSQKSSFETISGLSEILDRYDGFLVDQWGVMHDGQQAFDGAIDCISQLATTYNKKMVILSNSPSPLESETLQALQPMGFDPSHFQGAITSGRLAVDYLQEQATTKYNGRKLKILFMAWRHPAAPSYTTFLESLEDWVEIVDTADQADVLVVQGNEVLLSSTGKLDDDVSLGDFVFTGETNGKIDSILSDCAKHSVPLICIDPDLLTVNPDDSIFYMPGTIAKRYETAHQGQCEYFGKPHLPCFQKGIQRLKDAGVKDVSRMAMIGDSLEHDVKGAVAAGLDSIFLLGGVHRPDLGNLFGEVVPASRLDQFFHQHQQEQKEGVNLIPTVVAPILKI